MRLFEIKNRDGLALAGHLTLDGVQTAFPVALDMNEKFPDLMHYHHDNLSLFQEKMQENWSDLQINPGMLHPGGKPVTRHGDILLVPNWHTAFINPRNYIEWLVSIRLKSPPDTLWYAPACALPSNVHLLVYSGFSIFDWTSVDLKSAQGIFCLQGCELPKVVEREGFCSCEGCRSGSLLLHNRLALLSELNTVRYYIYKQQLREYVESRSRLSAFQVTVMRLLDQCPVFLEPFIPVTRSVQMLATTEDSLQRVEVKRFMHRVLSRYIPPRNDVAILIPCSARKPYSTSKSHRRLKHIIRGRGHELIITSPLGIVPRELERIYPAAHYDVPVTGYWSQEEKKIIGAQIHEYFKNNQYRRVIAYLEGGALETVTAAFSALEVDCEIITRDDPKKDSMSGELDDALYGEKRKRSDIVRGTCLYQFDTSINTENFILKGYSPEERVFRNKMQLFSFDAHTGYLRPTFQGWDLIKDKYNVCIDPFIPQGDILAPGVVGADPQIREGDEVIVRGKQAIATGRALMSGDCMVESTQGVAVKVRKVMRIEPQ